MDSTYNDKIVTFEICVFDAFESKDYIIPFDALYGMNAEMICKQIAESDNDVSFTLKGIGHLRKNEMITKEESIFKSIDAVPDASFEDIIEAYFTKEENSKNFTEVQKEHAAYFLKKYGKKAEKLEDKNLIR